MRRPMRPMLHARDLDETISFYTDVLGFDVENTMRDSSFNWCALSYGSGGIMFTSEQERTPALTGRLYFYADDVDATHAAIRARGGHALHEPRARTYGMYEFSIEDPNGYLLTFGAPIPAES